MKELIINILKNAESDEIRREEALQLFKGVRGVSELSELMKVASEVRDNEKGAIFKFDGFIGSITSCDTEPPCKYCSRSAGNRSDFAEKTLTIEEIEFGAKLIAETGTKRVEIGGGTPREGACEKVINSAKAIKKVSLMDVWVNVGPSLTREDLLRLKELGVTEVCSSLETINPEVFRDAKPGDSLEARMKLAEEINEVGLGLTSVMMVGIGSSYEDYVNHLFWLKKFENLSHVCITGLNPILGTPFQSKPLANPFEVAKAGAIARLVLRTPDISFGGMMNDPKLLPLWIMAGANRAIHLGAHIHRANAWRTPHAGAIVARYNGLEFVNLLPLTTRLVKEMGMEVDIE
jgi:biotin synthase